MVIGMPLGWRRIKFFAPIWTDQEVDTRQEMKLDYKPQGPIHTLHQSPNVSSEILPPKMFYNLQNQHCELGAKGSYV